MRRNVPLELISIQLYSVRNQMDADTVGTLTYIRDAGFTVRALLWDGQCVTVYMLRAYTTVTVDSITVNHEYFLFR